jgi:DNA-binding CsgD family transcriptional regulator
MDFVAGISRLLETIAAGCTLSAQHNVLCVESLEADFYAVSEWLGFPYARFSVLSNDYRDAAEKTRVWDAYLDSIIYSINFDSFPLEWRREYEKKQYWRKDPLLRVVLENENTTFVTTWQRAGCFDDSRSVELFRRAQRRGLRSGLLLAHLSGSRRSVISFAAPESEEELEQRFYGTALGSQALTVLLLMNSAVDKLSGCKRCMLCARFAGKNTVTMTRAQKAVLLLYHQNPNATLAFIAREQNICTETVKYHLKCVREKLGMPGVSGHVLANHAKVKHII